ncbi:MAG TPA: hypothetical protein VI959_00470 [Alphaproteobacteria bacterium]|nr:hypothetical protein [Alphaproteobacteria bacterium]
MMTINRIFFTILLLVESILAKTKTPEIRTFYQNGQICAAKYGTMSVTGLSIEDAIDLYAEMVDQCLSLKPFGTNKRSHFHPEAVALFKEDYYKKILKEGYGIVSKYEPDFPVLIGFLNTQGFDVIDDKDGFVTVEFQNQNVSSKKVPAQEKPKDKPLHKNPSIKKSQDSARAPKFYHEDDFEDEGEVKNSSQKQDHDLNKSLNKLGKHFMIFTQGVEKEVKKGKKQDQEKLDKKKNFTLSQNKKTSSDSSLNSKPAPDKRPDKRKDILSPEEELDQQFYQDNQSAPTS